MATAVTRRATAIAVPLLELRKLIANKDERFGKSAVTIKPPDTAELADHLALKHFIYRQSISQN